MIECSYEKDFGGVGRGGFDGDVGFGGAEVSGRGVGSGDF